MSNKTKNKIYICGPISGYAIEERKEKFEKLEKALASLGYEVVNPLRNGLPVDAPYSEHMKRDIANLLQCDYIYILQDWEQSEGAKLERRIALRCGIHIIYEQ